MINNYEKILIVFGQGTDVSSALHSLSFKLNELESKYEIIGPILITIDRHSSAVHNSVQVFASQMLGRVQTT